MVKVLEAVPNFSEGRDLDVVRSLVEVVAAHPVDVLDWSADEDHHRSVVTYIGAPPDVEAASIAVARLALELIDLRHHSGIHPRVGALDVLPFVPLEGLDMLDAVASAHRVGRAVAALGLPVFYYGYASDPPGRALAELRRGGVEALMNGFPDDRRADLPAGAPRPHPSAGVTCIGARRVLLAWNVFVAGVDLADVREIAGRIREKGGGFHGLRALGLHLSNQDRLQISMNLEDPEVTSPLAVFEALEAEVGSRGGYVEETQVIGMMPDTLVLPGTAGRLQLPDLGPSRVLSRRVADFVRAGPGGSTDISDATE